MRKDAAREALALKVSLALTAGMFSAVPAAEGAPVLDKVVTAGAQVAQSGKVTDVTSTVQKNVIQWKDFSVKNDETVRFDQGKKEKDYLNVVTGKNTSEIAGKIEGGHDVYLVNPNGVIFSQGAQVNVGNLYVSTENPEAAVKAFDAGKTAGEVLQAGTANADVVNLGGMDASKVIVNGDNIRFVTDEVRADEVTLTAAKTIAKEHWAPTATASVTAEAASSPVYTMNAASVDSDVTAIRDEAGLKTMNDNLSGSYSLEDDITLSGGYTPIGGNDYGAFTGKLDGHYHTVSGISVSDVADGGLFGYTDGASIQKVGVKDGAVKADYAGGIVGRAVDTTLTDVYNDGVTITPSGEGVGSYSAGGIAGSAEGSTIEKAYNTASVSGGAGILGYSNYTKVDNVYNTGKADYGLVRLNPGKNDASSVTNAYTTQGEAASPNFQGTNTGIKVSADDTSSSKYTGFDISNSGAGDTVWRIYEGKTLPLLRDFLRRDGGAVTVDYDYTQGTKSGANNGADLSLTYNAKDVVLSHITYTQANGETVDTSKIRQSGTTFHNANDYDDADAGGQVAFYSAQDGYDLIGNNISIAPKAITGIVSEGSVAAETTGKEYDGTTAVSADEVKRLLGDAYKTDVITGDTTAGLDTSAVQADYSDKNAGTGKKVTMNGTVTLKNADGYHNYTFTKDSAAVDQTLTGTITPRHLTASVSNPYTEKVYDGTRAVETSAGTAATADELAGMVTLKGTSADKGIVSGDHVTRTMTAAYASADAGTPGINYSIALSGADASNYTLDKGQIEGGGTITKRVVGVTFDPVNKIYDGTTEVKGDKSALNNVLDQDSLSLTYQAAYENANASSDANQNWANYTDLALAGDAAKNYALSSTTMKGVGTIKKRDITSDDIKTIWADTITKQYDGTSSVLSPKDQLKIAIRSEADGGVSGLKVGSSVGYTVKDGTTPHYIDAKGAEAKDAQANLAVSYDIDLTSSDLSNFNVTDGLSRFNSAVNSNSSSKGNVAPSTVSITKRILQAAVSGNQHKIYNGSAAADAPNLQLQDGTDGRSAADIESMLEKDGTTFSSLVTASYADKDASESQSEYAAGKTGTKTVDYALKLTDALQKNYAIEGTDTAEKTYTGTGDILRRIAYVDFADSKENTKTYDGSSKVEKNRAFSLSSDDGKGSGVLSGDTVTLDTTNVTGTYESAHVKRADDGSVSAQDVSYTGFALDNGNYEVKAKAADGTDSDVLTGQGTITPKELTVSLKETGVTKEYDGTTDVVDFTDASGTAHAYQTDNLTFSDGLVDGDTLKTSWTNGSGPQYASKDVATKNNTVTYAFNWSNDSSDGTSGNHDYDLKRADGSTDGITGAGASAQATLKTTGTITPRTVHAVLGDATKVEKTYDGKKSVAQDADSLSQNIQLDRLLTGTAADDGVTLDTSAIQASYDDKDAGVRTVTYHVALTGNGASTNYKLVGKEGSALAQDSSTGTGILTGAGVINKAPLTIDFGRVVKTYDGSADVTTTAEGTGNVTTITPTLTGFVNGESVTDTLTGISGFYTNGDGTSMPSADANVSRAGGTLNGSLQDKAVYYTGVDTAFETLKSSNDVLRNYEISQAGSQGQLLSSKGNGTLDTVYFSASSGKGRIQPQTVKAGDIKRAWTGDFTKVYDTTSLVHDPKTKFSLSVNLNADGTGAKDYDVDYVLKDYVLKDYVLNPAAYYSQADQGKGLKVTYALSKINQKELGNYTIDDTTVSAFGAPTYYTTNGTITPKKIYAGLKQTKDLSKIYDSTTNADASNLAFYNADGTQRTAADKDAYNQAVGLNGVYASDADAVKTSVSAAYDNKQATIRPGDDLTNSRHITYTLSLNDTTGKGNYVLDGSFGAPASPSDTKNTYAATGDIVRRQVVVDFTKGAPTGIDKTYDGSDEADITKISGYPNLFTVQKNTDTEKQTGVIGDDDVSVDTGEVKARYSSPHVQRDASTGQAVAQDVNFSNFQINGKDADNYYVDTDALKGSGTIKPKSVSVSLRETGVQKEYDGTTNVADFTDASGTTHAFATDNLTWDPGDLATGDKIVTTWTNGSGPQYASKDVKDNGNNTVTYAFSWSNTSSDGTSGNHDYDLSIGSGDGSVDGKGRDAVLTLRTQGTITPRRLTATLENPTAVVKTYDSTTKIMKDGQEQNIMGDVKLDRLLTGTAADDGVTLDTSASQAAYEDADAGTKNVLYHIALTGKNADTNYQVFDKDGRELAANDYLTGTGTITPKKIYAQLTNPTDITKIYDGTVDVPEDAQQNLAFYDADGTRHDASYTDGNGNEIGANGIYAKDKDQVTTKVIAAYDDKMATIDPGAAHQNARKISYTLSLTDDSGKGNYELDTSFGAPKTHYQNENIYEATGDIVRRVAYVDFAKGAPTGIDKPYDGSAAADVKSISGYPDLFRTLAADDAAGTGIVAGDQAAVDAGAAEAAYASAHVRRSDAGEPAAQAVYFTNFTLTGADKDNYVVALNPSSQYRSEDGTKLKGSGTITPRTVSAWLKNTDVQKVYDGTTDVVDSTAAFAMDNLAWDETPVVSGDTIVTSWADGKGPQYASKNVRDNGNNTVTYAFGWSNTSKDGTSGNHDYNLSIGAGSGKVTGQGKDAVLKLTTQGTITPKTVTAALKTSPTEVTKTYDGNTSVLQDVSGDVQLDGLVSGDGAKLDTEAVHAAYADKDAGENKDVIYHVALTGDDGAAASNYTLVGADGSALPQDSTLKTGVLTSRGTGTITKKTLTLDFGRVEKTFDGNGRVVGTITPTLKGLVDGESAAFDAKATSKIKGYYTAGDGTGELLPDADVAYDGGVQDKAVYYTGLKKAFEDLASRQADVLKNYDIDSNTAYFSQASGKGRINPYALSPEDDSWKESWTQVSKVYDNTRDVPQKDALSLSAKKYGQKVNIAYDFAGASYDDENAGTNHVISYRLGGFGKITNDDGSENHNFRIADDALSQYEDGTVKSAADNIIEKRVLRAAITNPYTQKTYDGTTRVIDAEGNEVPSAQLVSFTSTNAPNGTGLVAGDGVSNATTASYQDKNAGTPGICYTLALSGSKAGNYAFADGTTSLEGEGTINKKDLSLDIPFISRSYDGTSTITKDDLSGLSFHAADFVNGESADVDLAHVTADFVDENGNLTADVNYVTDAEGKGSVGYRGVKLDLSNAFSDADKETLRNYTIKADGQPITDTVYFTQAQQKGQIRQFALTPGDNASNWQESWRQVRKEYDGTTGVPDQNALTLTAEKFGHKVKIGYALDRASYDNADAGTNHQISYKLTGLTDITDDDGGLTQGEINHNFTLDADAVRNYTAEARTSGAEHIITPRVLQVRVKDGASLDKVYDGTAEVKDPAQLFELYHLDADGQEDTAVEDRDKDALNVLYRAYYTKDAGDLTHEKNAGEGRGISYSAGLDGTAAKNYTLHTAGGDGQQVAEQLTGRTGTIAKRKVYADFAEGRGTGIDKSYGAYGGKTAVDAAHAGDVVLRSEDGDTGIVAADQDKVTLDRSQLQMAYADGNVHRDADGTLLTQDVSFSNFQLAGADEDTANYTLAVYGPDQTKLTGSGTITPAVVHVDVTPGTVTKEYDGTADLTEANRQAVRNSLSVRSQDMMLGESVDALGLSDADATTYGGSDAGTYDIAYNPLSWSNGNYALVFSSTDGSDGSITAKVDDVARTASLTDHLGTITKRKVKITGARGGHDVEKTYDGTTALLDNEYFTGTGEDGTYYASNLSFDRILDADKTANRFGVQTVGTYDDANAADSVQQDQKQHTVSYRDIRLTNANYELVEDDGTPWAADGTYEGSGLIKRAELTAVSEPAYVDNRIPGRRFGGQVTGWKTSQDEDALSGSFRWDAEPGARQQTGEQALYGWYREGGAQQDGSSWNWQDPSRTDVKQQAAATDGLSVYRAYGNVDRNYELVQAPSNRTALTVGLTDTPEHIDSQTKQIKQFTPGAVVYPAISADDHHEFEYAPRASIVYENGGVNAEAAEAGELQTVALRQEDSRVPRRKTSLVLMPEQEGEAPSGDADMRLQPELELEALRKAGAVPAPAAAQPETVTKIEPESGLEDTSRPWLKRSPLFEEPHAASEKLTTDRREPLFGDEAFFGAAAPVSAALSAESSASTAASASGTAAGTAAESGAPQQTLFDEAEGQPWAVVPDEVLAERRQAAGTPGTAPAAQAAEPAEASAAAEPAEAAPAVQPSLEAEAAAQDSPEGLEISTADDDAAEDEEKEEEAKAGALADKSAHIAIESQGTGVNLAS